MSVSFTPSASRLASAASFFFVAVVLLAAAVPGVRAGSITACDGISSGDWEIDAGSAGGGEISLWGFSSTRCYGTSITGLPHLRSFSLWLKLSNSAAATTAVGVVLDATTTQYQNVTSVDISALLPTATDSAFHRVTADFGSMVALNASRTYVLAFCASAGVNNAFTLDGASDEVNSFRYCNGNYAACLTDGTLWESFAGSTMRTGVTGSCGSSASHLAPWGGALAHITALLNAFWH